MFALGAGSLRQLLSSQTNILTIATLWLRAAASRWGELTSTSPHCFRFRYECEGRSAGSILGKTSKPESKTYPAIKVQNWNVTGMSWACHVLPFPLVTAVRLLLSIHEYYLFIDAFLPKYLIFILKPSHSPLIISRDMIISTVGSVIFLRSIFSGCTLMEIIETQ